MAHLYLSAAHKSSGKTTLAIGLAAALVARGLSVQTFKRGPDYIDSMWLSRASGRACFNLDFHTQSNDEILATFAHWMEGADLGLIEGNKGLYDGLDVEGLDSNAALAKLLGAPVILVIDAEGMTRGIAPLIQGYRAFDGEVDIRGVILNRVGGARHEGKLMAALERYTDVKALGAVYRDDILTVPERHLGLTTPKETKALDEKIEAIESRVRDCVNLEALQSIAETAGTVKVESAPTPGRGKDLRVGIARDAAFGFYYPDDLTALEDAGAELVFFDALRDAALPEVDGLFIGGGFPEMQMWALEANGSLRAHIRQALARGMPAYAECGGLMYLCRRLIWGDAVHDMAGVIPADAVINARPQGRGFVRLKERKDFPWPAGGKGHDLNRELPAHEFHYASLEKFPTNLRFGYDVLRGEGVDGRHDGIVIGNLLASFSHLRDTAANHWARRFAAFVRDCKAASGGKRIKASEKVGD